MRIKTVAAVVGLLALGGCVAPVGPVEVTRFHLPDTSVLGKGTIAVEPAPGQNGDSMEFRSYAAAVEQQLAAVGYSIAPGTASSQVALLKLDRQTSRPERARGPVSVGVGGAAGSWGSGAGVGVGIDLSGPPPQQIETSMAVAIKDRAAGTRLWEGRASFTVRASSPLASTQLGAPKLAEALFKDFPGNSGETIQVQ
jgi:hypothetical protein